MAGRPSSSNQPPPQGATDLERHAAHLAWAREQLRTAEGRRGTTHGTGARDRLDGEIHSWREYINEEEAAYARAHTSENARGRHPRGAASAGGAAAAAEAAARAAQRQQRQQQNAQRREQARAAAAAAAAADGAAAEAAARAAAAAAASGARGADHAAGGPCALGLAWH